MADGPRFTSVQRVASAHAKLLAMAEGFDGLLTELLRTPEFCVVADELLLRDREGVGLLLRIEAQLLTAAQIQERESTAQGGQP